MDRTRDNRNRQSSGGARDGRAPRQGRRGWHGLRCLEVRAPAWFVLTVVYRVAGSMRSRLGSRQPACDAQGPHAGPSARSAVIFCSRRATARCMRVPGALIARPNLDAVPIRGILSIVLVPRVAPGGRGTRVGARRVSSCCNRGCPRNCERRAFRPRRPLGNWEGWAKGNDPRARRPASTVTQPVGGAHHTERLFAAVTREPMWGPCEMFLTTSVMSGVRPGSGSSAVSAGR
jgi:hypothetical protein